MESPPSSSTWSEAFILSDDSGLLLTNGSASSSSMNDDSKNGKKYFAFEVCARIHYYVWYQVVSITFTWIFNYLFKKSKYEKNVFNSKSK